MNFAAPHFPVMLPEVLVALQPKAGEVYVDGTMGAGGYTRAILDAAPCRVIAFDRDATAHTMAAQWEKPYAESLTRVHSSFGEMRARLTELGVDRVDAIILDLGVSSMQFDEGERGFSFRFDAPLDMRMDRSTGETAADIVNGTPEKELADLIYLYGEERASRRIAAAIVRARQSEKITTTAQLANIIRAVIPKAPQDKIDPATRSFQALRIAVNNELGELETLLESSAELLNAGGRLIVVTFHSLEDRIVKNFMYEKARPAPSPSRHLPTAMIPQNSLLSFTLPSRKPVLPSDSELKINPRSRSAKLRVAIYKGEGAQS